MENMDIIGTTGANSQPSLTEFRVTDNAVVRLGMFVQVEPMQGGDIVLCKVVDLRWKKSGTGTRQTTINQGKLSPVSALLQPIPPDSDVFVASPELIKETLGVSSTENKVVIGKLIGTDVDICLDPKKLNKHLVVLGKTGSGKSYTTTGLIEGLLQMGGVTMIIIDPHDEFRCLKEVPEFADRVVVLEPKLPTMKQLHQEGKCVILPLTGIENDMQPWLVKRVAYELFNALKRKEIKPFLLFIDEAHKFIPQRGTTDCKQELTNCVMEGRKFGLGVVMMTQRTAKLDKDVLSQCASQIVLQLVNNNDLTAIASSCEGVGKQEKDHIQKLDVGEALVMGVGIRTPIFVKVKQKRSPDETVELIAEVE